jgi:hypothetical protein
MRSKSLGSCDDIGMDQVATTANTTANTYVAFFAEPLRGGAVRSRNGPLKLRA